MLRTPIYVDKFMWDTHSANRASNCAFLVNTIWHLGRFMGNSYVYATTNNHHMGRALDKYYFSNDEGGFSVNKPRLTTDNTHGRTA